MRESEAARSAVAEPLAPVAAAPLAPAAPRGAPGRRPPSPPPLRQERRRRPHGSNFSSSPAPSLACRATLKGHRENTTHASLIQIGRGLQESLSRVLSVWREVRRDERQEPADWRSTREGFVAIKGRAERIASPPPPPGSPAHRPVDRASRRAALGCALFYLRCDRRHGVSHGEPVKSIYALFLP